MNNLTNFIKENKSTIFNIAFNDFVDSEGLPIPCTIEIDKEYEKIFDEFGKKEEGNIFAHFGGITTEY